MRLNRILPALAALVAAAGATVHAATLTLSSPAPVTVGTPLQVDLGIHFDSGESLYAYQFDVLFSAFLEADSVLELGFFGDNSLGLFSIIDNSAGKLSVFSSLSGSDSLTTDETFLRINFNTLAPNAGFVDFDPSSLILLDPGFNDLPATLTSGYAMVNWPSSGGGAETPEPSTIWTISGGLALVLCSRLRRRQLPLQPPSRE